ncbi:MAG: hypothetical protein H6707_19500 [Deltaproteobacteria bacterium]|nr:hypothetical protein [Deltaproteobacteria bacterium]
MVFRTDRTRSSGALPLLCGLLLIGAIGGCQHQLRRFPLAPALWNDPDRNNVAQSPSKYYSGLIADAMDKLVWRPLARLPYMPLARSAQNVNALDEVPNSSWFQNRIGHHALSDAQIALGACGNGARIDPRQGPWTVIAAKPDGANPGFFINTPTGRYLLKFDGKNQPLRASASDVIGSRIYWAVGYHTPCNEIVYFSPKILAISPKATTKNSYGEERPITPVDVEKVLAAAYRKKDGMLRALASRFLPGKPLGPFRYEARRADDPNDVIDHEHRRELRANRILSAWLNHHDAREQNSLDLWVTDRGRNYVRHYMIDFGDCFGGRWEFDQLTRRTGHSYLFDIEDVPVDFLTLGMVPRPWYRAKINEENEIFGYFGIQDFVPSKWKTDYPNAAFIEMDHADALWMARILSRFSDTQIRRMVEQGKLHSKRAEDYLTRTLIGRRDLILKEYLTRYAPLDRFRLVRRQAGQATQSLCFEDLAIRSGVVDARAVTYKIRSYGGERGEREIGWLQFQPDPEHPHRSCIQLPLGERRPADLAGPTAPDHAALRYGIVRIWITQKPSIPPTSSIGIHLYDLGVQRGFRLVGITRPPRPVPSDIF